MGLGPAQMGLYAKRDFPNGSVWFFWCVWWFSMLFGVIWRSRRVYLDRNRMRNRFFSTRGAGSISFQACFTFSQFPDLFGFFKKIRKLKKRMETDGTSPSSAEKTIPHAISIQIHPTRPPVDVKNHVFQLDMSRQKHVFQPEVWTNLVHLIFELMFSIHVG